MDKQKHLYWAFQSSHTTNPTEKELELFKTKYKENYEQRITYEGETLLDKFRLNSWRSPIYNKITSIILAFEHESTLRVKYIEGEEHDLLQNFANLLKNSFREYQLVHFDAEIVLPYINVRLNKNGFINSLHQDLKFFNLRPWNLTGLDIKAYYQGAGKYSFSLEEIAHILNIDCEGIIPYDSEFNYYELGKFEELNNSAVKKIETLSKIHRKLNSLPELETVIVKESVKDVVEEKPKDFLKELYYANQMTVEIKEGLKQQIFGGKKKVTKKELEHLKDLILSHYQTKSDKKADKERKENEIKEFLGL